jgi:hypothetical protein
VIGLFSDEVLAGSGVFGYAMVDANGGEQAF